VASTAHRAQRPVEVVLELGELAVDVDVAFAAESVGLRVGRVDQAGGLGGGGRHDLGLGHQALLLLDALLNGLLVGEVAVLDQPVGLGLRTSGTGVVLALRGGSDPLGLVAGLTDHPFTVLARLGDHPIRRALGVGQDPIRLRPGVVEQRVRLGSGRRDHRFGVLLGLAEHAVAGVKHVLGVVELTGDGVLDVVYQLEHVTTGHHAPSGHRHAAGFFHDCAELVERLKYSVHGNTLQA